MSRTVDGRWYCTNAAHHFRISEWRCPRFRTARVAGRSVTVWFDRSALGSVHCGAAARSVRRPSGATGPAPASEAVELLQDEVERLRQRIEDYETAIAAAESTIESLRAALAECRGEADELRLEADKLGLAAETWEEEARGGTARRMWNWTAEKVAIGCAAVALYKWAEDDG